MILINCNWVVSRWQWLFYIYTKFFVKNLNESIILLTDTFCVLTSVIKHRAYVRKFGTKSLNISRSVQLYCVSFRNVTFMLGSCKEICGYLDFVKIPILFVSLCCAKRRNIHPLHSEEIHKNDQSSYFAEFLLRIASLHTILHEQLLCAACMNVCRNVGVLERSA